MKITQHFLILSSLLSLFIIHSCKTDFELNAPYDDIPVVFAALDQSLDTQYVKINKTYLGTGDNTTYASINDSVLFPNLSARVDEIFNGNITNSFQLEEKWVPVEDGIFYNGTQKVYFFPTPTGLNPSAKYKLTVNIDEGRKIVTAETRLVEDFNFKATFINKGISGFNFAGANATINNSYPKFRVEWTTAKGGKRYEASLRFFYKEVMQNNDTIAKYFDWFLGSEEALNTNGGQDMSKEVKGDGLYKMVASKLANHPNENDVVKRLFSRIEFRVAAAGDELSTYISVNEPSSSIVSERPNYTNITNGLGIFSSRYNLIYDKNPQTPTIDLTLNTSSLEELKNGQYTGHLKFQ